MDIIDRFVPYQAPVRSNPFDRAGAWVTPGSRGGFTVDVTAVVSQVYVVIIVCST